MRKGPWVIAILLLFVGIAAPNALANTLFTYTYTYTPMPGSTFSFTTGPLNPAVALGMPQTAFKTATFTGFYAGTVLVLYVLDGSSPLAPGANFLTQVTGGPLLGPPESFFSPSDYTSAGTYTGSCVLNCLTGPATMVVSAVPTPEPFTGGLVMLGIGLVSVVRKRIARGLPPQAN